jgi:hypothetical protein
MADETKIMQRKRNERTKKNSWNRESRARGWLLIKGRKKNFLKTGEVKNLKIGRSKIRKKFEKEKIQLVKVIRRLPPCV